MADYVQAEPTVASMSTGMSSKDGDGQHFEYLTEQSPYSLGDLTGSRGPNSQTDVKSPYPAGDLNGSSGYSSQTDVKSPYPVGDLNGSSGYCSQTDVKSPYPVGDLNGPPGPSSGTDVKSPYTASDLNGSSGSSSQTDMISPYPVGDLNGSPGPSSQTEVKLAMEPDECRDKVGYTEEKKQFNPDGNNRHALTQGTKTTINSEGVAPTSHTVVTVPYESEGSRSHTEPKQRLQSDEESSASNTELKQVVERQGNMDNTHTEPKRPVNSAVNEAINSNASSSLTGVKVPVVSESDDHSTSSWTESERPVDPPSEIPYTFTEKGNSPSPNNHTQWTTFDHTENGEDKVTVVNNHNTSGQHSSTEVKRPFEQTEEPTDTVPVRERPPGWVTFPEAPEAEVAGPSSLPAYNDLPSDLQQGPSSMTQPKEVNSAPQQGPSSRTHPKEVHYDPQQGPSSVTQPKEVNYDPQQGPSSRTHPKEVHSETSPPEVQVRRTRHRPPSPHPRVTGDGSHSQVELPVGADGESSSSEQLSESNPPSYADMRQNDDSYWTVEGNHRQARQAIGDMHTDEENLLEEEELGGCGAPRWAIAVAIVLTVCIVISVCVVLAYTLRQSQTEDKPDLGLN